MKPSHTAMRLPGFPNEDLGKTTHDALQAWLLRAVCVPGFGEHLMSRTMRTAPPMLVGVETEAAIIENKRIIGFTDALRLWIEIKADDRDIGALMRQVKVYKRSIIGDGAHWLALLPEASAGALELLAQARIGAYLIGETTFPGLPSFGPDLVSATARREEAERKAGPFAPIPDVGPKDDAPHRPH